MAGAQPTVAGAPAIVFSLQDAYNSQTGLLRTIGSAAKSERQGYSLGISQAGAEISPGLEPGRQIGGRKIQAIAGSLRRPLRFQEAADVRPVRFLQRKPSAGRTRRGGPPRRGAGRQL